MDNPFEFARNLLKYISGISSTHEENEVRSALDHSQKLNKLAEHFHDQDLIREKLVTFDSFSNEDAAWTKVMQKVHAGNHDDRKRFNIMSWRRIQWAAAVIVVMAGVGIFYFTGIHSASQRQDVAAVSLRPEFSLAIAESNNHCINDATIETSVSSECLGGTNRHSSGHGSAITSGTSEAFNPHGEKLKEMLSATRVTTRHDREYWLTLPDGSMVHLGYGTKIVYSSQMEKDMTRDVYLDGEAYFIVSKDDRHPFNVLTDAATVTVHGTEFCVETGSDTESCEIVLVEGAVSVRSNEGTQFRLAPGQMANVTADAVFVTDVDTSPYLARVTGHIDFSGWPLSKVMDLLGRWYGMNISYSSLQCMDELISGSLDRYDSLGPTLESISLITGYSITQHGKNIIISQ